MIYKSKNLIFIVLGCLSFLLGVIGIILPVMPTTPFAILAAYFFSKGSPRAHKWLISQPIMGPIIIKWEEQGAISLRVKILATSMMFLLFSYTLFFKIIVLWVKILIFLIGTSILTFIWTRPIPDE